ncbi:MAG: hypothetical protein QM656_16650 [Paracoccaceae bacterium]
MQLLIQTTAPDFTAWKSAFDAEGENIQNAGLSTMQIWKGEGSNVLVLFEVHNRARAEEWLAKQAAFGHGCTQQFLQTA